MKVKENKSKGCVGFEDLGPGDVFRCQPDGHMFMKTDCYSRNNAVDLRGGTYRFNEGDIVQPVNGTFVEGWEE